jgi:hypothetical protein
MDERAARLQSASPAEVAIGELIAIADHGVTPFVVYAGQSGTAALRARSVIDLRDEHVGQTVVLGFEKGDPSLPIIMGVLRSSDHQSSTLAAPVHVEADGERMIVHAKEQLVMRCGKASITLTKAGKVIIEGSYVVSRSTGVNRIKGGSVQLN